MARKKRAWNMSNPLYRYLHGKKRSRAKRSRGVSMARKKRYGRSRGGLGSLTPVLYGAGAAFLAPRVGLNFNPLLVGAAGGFMARKNIMGAVMGAGGAYLANMFLGGASTSAAGNDLP